MEPERCNVGGLRGAGELGLALPHIEHSDRAPLFSKVHAAQAHVCDDITSPNPKPHSRPTAGSPIKGEAKDSQTHLPIFLWPKNYSSLFFLGTFSVQI